MPPLQPRHRYKLPNSWLELLQYFQADGKQILHLAKLPENLFERPGAELNTVEYLRLWRALDSYFADPLMPIKLCKATFTEIFEVAIFAGLCCENGAQGLSQMARFKPLVAPITFHLEEEQETATITQLNLFEGPLEVPPSLALLDLIFPMEMLRLATGKMSKPIKVELQTLSKDIAAFEDYFGCEIVQGDVNRVTLNRNDLYVPFKTADQKMWKRFEQSLDDKLRKLDQNTPYTSRVRSKLLELLPAGHCTIESVAEELNIGTRSLQRRLKAEKSSFREILNETRSELALHYIKNNKLKNYEISFLLGFEDQNSFFRAFQNWLGTTPDSFRATFAKI